MSGTDGRLYRTARWARCRAIQLGREPMCQSCENKPAEHVDHIKRVKAGGAFWDSDNWQSLCPSCHSEKTVAEQAGRTWTPAKWKGCFADGSPRDPRHEWYTGGSITKSADPRTASIPQNRISKV